MYVTYTVDASNKVWRGLYFFLFAMSYLNSTFANIRVDHIKLIKWKFPYIIKYCPIDQFKLIMCFSKELLVWIKSNNVCLMFWSFSAIYSGLLWS